MKDSTSKIAQSGSGNGIVFLLCSACVALLITVAFMAYRQVNYKVETAERIASLEQEIERLREEQPDLEIESWANTGDGQSVGDAEISRNEISETAPVSNEDESAIVEERERERIIRNITANVSSSGMNALIEKQQRTIIAEEFGELIDFLDLNADEKDYFLDLLTSRKMLQVELGMKLMTGALTEEETLAMTRQIDVSTREINEEIGYFLNDERDNEYFDFYDKSGVERSAIRSMRAEAEKSGIPIEPDVGERLVALINEEVNNHSYSNDFGSEEQPDFSQFTDENINQHAQEMRMLLESLMAKASQTLSADQLLFFEQAYLQYVDTQIQNMKVAQQFFNPQGV